METRKILAYHHQFDSMRIDGLAQLYKVLDYLRIEVRGCTEGFAYYNAPKALVVFLSDEKKRPLMGRRGKEWVGHTPRHFNALNGLNCMVVDLDDGFIRSLGFPILRDGTLWFPALKARLIRTDIYEHIRPLPRPLSLP